MKNFVSYLIVLCVCTHVSFAGFSDGYITTGEYEYGVEWFTSNPPLIVNGGGADGIEMRNSGFLEVHSTSIPVNGNWYSGGITTLLIDDNSNLSYNGGYTKTLSIYGNANAIITGGSINMIRSFQLVNNSPHITIECQPDWSWVYQSGNIKGITGLWEYDNPFSIDFIDKDYLGYDPVWQNINVVEVPEPVTLALFGLGGLLIRRKK